MSSLAREAARSWAIEFTRRHKLPIGIAVFDRDAMVVRFSTTRDSPMSPFHATVNMRLPLLTRAMSTSLGLQALVGKTIRPMERPKGENVVDLMEALRRSVGGVASAETKASKKPAKKPRKAAAGQKEMLMPIAGKKKETAAKKPAAKPQRRSA